MGESYAKLMFTPLVKELQILHGSRAAYERMEQLAGDRLSVSEAQFISLRDSFYMASTTETGWPYMQHRGGARGFVRVIDDRTIAFADLRGNRQYMSVGNLSHDNRVFLFFMDYPNRARLKLVGFAEIHEGADAALLERLRLPTDKAPSERIFVIRVAGFDWNCSKRIIPRYTEEEVIAFTAPVLRRLEDLQAENTRLHELIVTLSGSSDR